MLVFIISDELILGLMSVFLIMIVVWEVDGDLVIYWYEEDRDKGYEVWLMIVFIVFCFCFFCINGLLGCYLFFVL